MAEFRTVCKVGDIPAGEGKTVVVGEKLVALFRDRDGFHAIDDLCPHMGASLGAGCLENGVVTCPWHAWRFRVADGTWADNPRVKIPCYPVRVVGDEVQVQPPDPRPRPTPGDAP
jgi:nitrite reductase (NADH) small subunit/3-phenylpropionate/trans-cinnamate dioxygenase ferredoxin subunit